MGTEKMHLESVIFKIYLCIRQLLNCSVFSLCFEKFVLRILIDFKYETDFHIFRSI